jgi:dolichol-phosphate mannosyltransferase
MNENTLASAPSPRHLIVPMGLGAAIDLALTLTLLGRGWAQGTANITGFLAGMVTWLLFRAWQNRGAQRLAAPHSLAASAGSHLVVGALALGLRGGAVATALAYGLPGWAAVMAGLGVAWTIAAIGRTFQAPSSVQAGDMRWPRAAAGILGSILLLHLLYLKVFPLAPEEAYYWNYSIRPALGYLDHPPMVAWLIALPEAVFGHGVASIRMASLACAAVMATFVYRFALRLVDQPAALMAAAFSVLMPYAFFVEGLLITPDAPLAAAWAGALYFLHRALVGEERRAWYGAGIALGIGMLSKYTIVILGPAALAFCLLDRRARAWLLRPQPYLAVLIVALLFTPVIYWNFVNDWASFRFQSSGRFDQAMQFSLHTMLENMLIVATPLPLMVLPLLFASQWTGQRGQIPETSPEPAHAQARNRLFVACFVFAPLAVFAWSALKHEPRLNWTGPIWLATMPLLGWAIVRADTLQRFGLGAALRLTAGTVIGALLVIYSLMSYHLVLGIPGVPYSPSLSRAVGWQAATRELQAVQARLVRETGAAPVFVGMDKYNTASQIAFFGTRPDESSGLAPMKVTSIEALTGNALMFTFWDPPGRFDGRTLVMVSRNKEALETARLETHFRELDPAIHPLALANSGPGGDGRHITNYFYRIGHGYRP